MATLYDVFAPDLGVPTGRDFSNLYAAGKLAITGRAYEAFDLNTFRLALRDYAGVLSLQNYSYPPHALLIAAPFALLPYGMALTLWTLLGLGFFYWAAKPDVKFAPVLSILTPAAALSVWNGHYGLLLGGLWLLYFRLLKDRPLASGLIAAAMTFKPHMGLFIGLTALTKWRALLAATAGIAALILISAWLFGGASWYGFIGQTIGAQTEILSRQANEFYFRLMPSAYTAYGRGTIAIVAQVVTAVAAIGLLIRYRRIDPFVLATATFLIVPYVFVYDMTVVCLGFANILWMGWQRLATWERVALTLAFLSPVITILWPLVSPMLVPPSLLAGLYIQTKLESTAAGQ
ncbi:MAG: DUF2029 domain-containing protein [Pseudomonadota bacterium]|nr:DUF2029 domain-containing protein [Pseudomonadota bacterium]